MTGRRYISMAILVLAVIAFCLFGEFFGQGLALFSTGNWRYVLCFWLVVIVLAIPGVLLLAGHAKRVVAPPAVDNRKFWTLSILFNAALFLPMAYLLFSNIRMVLGGFGNTALIAATFPFLGIILSFFALRLR